MESLDSPGKEKKNLMQLLTSECREDLKSCITGFVSMCKEKAQQNLGTSIIASNINSDHGENIFVNRETCVMVPTPLP